MGRLTPTQQSVTATGLLARCARYRRDSKIVSCVPGARSEQVGGRFYRVTSDQVLDCALESASQRRGRGPECEGQQETRAFGECAQAGWGGSGMPGTGPNWRVDSTRFWGAF